MLIYAAFSVMPLHHLSFFFAEMFTYCELDPSEKRPVFLILVTGKGFALFYVKTGFSLQWGLGASQISSLQRLGLKMLQVGQAL